MFAVDGFVIVGSFYLFLTPFRTVLYRGISVFVFLFFGIPTSSGNNTGGSRWFPSVPFVFFFLLLFSPSRRCSFRFSTGWVHDVLCDIRVVRQRQSPRRGPITHPHRTQISFRRAIVIIGTMHDPTTKKITRARTSTT